MATLKEPFALDRSLNTTEVTPRNIADVLAEGLSHITGRTASEVEYDNTDSGLTADNVQDALDEIAESVPTLPTTDIQTAVDEFETYNGGLLSALKVSLTPNQDLHGYAEPWVGGAGKNKAPYTLANLITSNTSGTWNSNVYTLNGVEFTVYTDDGGNVIAIKANGQNNGNQSLFILYFTLKDSNTYIVSGCPSGGASSTYEVYANLGNGSVYDKGSGAETTAVANYNGYVSIAIRAGYNAQNLMFYPMLRLSTESDPTFAPYSNICPISGHTQVEVGDDGKNRIPYVEFGILNQTDGSEEANNDNKRTGFIYVPKHGNYTISGLDGSNIAIRIFEYDKNKNYIRNYLSVTFTGALTIITNENVGYVRFQGNKILFASDTAQLEEGSTATAYEPYNGYQITVNLGGTYYSGTLDVVTGVFVPDMASVDLGTLTWTYQSNYPRFRADAPSGIKFPSSTSIVADAICDIYKTVSMDVTQTKDSSIGIGTSAYPYIYAHDTRYTDANVYKTAMSGVMLVYELATPLTIQLSPTMVKALVGENHLSAPLEGQEITESKYKQTFTFDDVNAQIESTYSEGISHNSVYRGKYLGDHVTDEQWDAIGDGSFRDLYIGDYWTINGINWRIAHFNYWLGTGDVKCNTNHVVIVPYGWVSTFNMNASDDTTGGYLNSEWYTTNRHFAVENIEADFGASHILSHRNFFSDAVSDGHASHGMWVDSTVDLMNEIMVCGSLVGSYLGKYYEVGCDKFQLALFKYNPPSARMDVSYWLRGVSTASSFVAMGNFGLLDGFTASQILKIRPVFAIKK